MADLNHKQQLFVKEYLIDQNGSRAALAAGYSSNKRAAAVRAQRLLTRRDIRHAINVALQERQDEVEYRAVDVLRGLKEIADADIARCYDERGDVLPLHKIPKSVRKTISSIETVVTYKTSKSGKRIATGAIKKLKFWDKTKALELSGKHMKLFTDKTEVSGPNGGPVQTATVVVLPAKDSKK
jgi:phage terminase small subunit